MYNVIPLADLPEFTPENTYSPASYEAAPKRLLDRPSTMADVAEFVMEYINSDVRIVFLIHKKRVASNILPGRRYRRNKLASHSRQQSLRYSGQRLYHLGQSAQQRCRLSQVWPAGGAEVYPEITVTPKT